MARCRAFVWDCTTFSSSLVPRTTHRDDGPRFDWLWFSKVKPLQDRCILKTDSIQWLHSDFDQTGKAWLKCRLAHRLTAANTKATATEVTSIYHTMQHSQLERKITRGLKKQRDSEKTRGGRICNELRVSSNV